MTTSTDRLRSIRTRDLSPLCSRCIDDFIMAQNCMYEFRVQMTSQDCVKTVVKALVDHGFQARDIITSLPQQKVFVPATKSVQEVLHIIRLTGRPVAYAGFGQELVEVIHLTRVSHWPSTLDPMGRL